MIRIAHLITGLSTGGSEMALYRIATGMDRTRFSNQIVSLTDIGPVGELIVREGIPVIALGMRPGVPSITKACALWRWLRQEQPHIVQTWLYHADLLGLVGAFTAGIATVVWNIRCSNMDLTRYRKLTTWVMRVCARLSRLPSAVIVNSEAGRQYHLGIGYHPRRWEVIPNGIDLEQYRPDHGARLRLRQELGVSGQTALIGLMARFDPMKDHANFLQAAATLHGLRSDVNFVLCGRGVDTNNPQLRGWINDFGLASVTHLLGERRDIHRIAAGLDIASSSSSFGEGFPNVIAEAMACGVPCVATDVGDSRQIIGETGRVVPPKRADMLAAAWLDLLKLNPEEMLRLGEAARQRVEDHYSLPLITARYEALYEDLTWRSNGYKNCAMKSNHRTQSKIET